MFIRIFTIANDEKKSKSIGDNLLLPLKKHVLKKKYVVNRQYWKFKEMFELEIELFLKNSIPESILNDFFLSISDKWETYSRGNEKEILISNTMKDCKFKNPDISMINMFLEKSEIF